MTACIRKLFPQAQVICHASHIASADFYFDSACSPTNSTEHTFRTSGHEDFTVNGEHLDKSFFYHTPKWDNILGSEDPAIKKEHDCVSGFSSVIVVHKDEPSQKSEQQRFGIPFSASRPFSESSWSVVLDEGRASDCQANKDSLQPISCHTVFSVSACTLSGNYFAEQQSRRCACPGLFSSSHGSYASHSRSCYKNSEADTQDMLSAVLSYTSTELPSWDFAEVAVEQSTAPFSQEFSQTQYQDNVEMSFHSNCNRCSSKEQGWMMMEEVPGLVVDGLAVEDKAFAVEANEADVTFDAAGALMSGALARLQKKKKEWEDFFCVLSCKNRDDHAAGGHVDFAYKLDLFESKAAAAASHDPIEGVHVQGASVKFVQGTVFTVKTTGELNKKGMTHFVSANSEQETREWLAAFEMVPEVNVNWTGQDGVELSRN